MDLLKRVAHKSHSFFLGESSIDADLLFRGIGNNFEFISKHINALGRPIVASHINT